MKKIGIAIFSVVVIIIMIVIFLIFVLKENNSNTVHTDLLNNIGNETNVTNNDDTISNVSNIIENTNISTEEYFRVVYAVRNYLEILNTRYYWYYKNPLTGEETGTYDASIQKQYIADTLSTAYMSKNQINKENMLTKIELLNERVEFYPTEIVNISNGSVKTYKAKGVSQNIDGNNKKMGYFVVHITNDEKAFSIEPSEEEAYSNSIFESILNIEINDNNQFKNMQMSKHSTASEVFYAYKNITMAQPKNTYSKMTDEYKNKRFGSYEAYEKYVKDNYDFLSKIKPAKYLEEDAENENQYIIKDQYDNTYIFEIKTPLNYMVMLDTYTIELEKTKKQYEYMRNEKKAYLNVTKFFEMINNKDYKTALNYLDDSFKQSNKINSEQDLEGLVKNTFLPYNKLELLAEKKEDNEEIYYYRLKLADLLGESSVTKEITVQVEQKEENNFTIQFK